MKETGHLKKKRTRKIPVSARKVIDIEKFRRAASECPADVAISRCDEVHLFLEKNGKAFIKSLESRFGKP